MELGRDFTSLRDRSRTFKCVNSLMLSGRVEIFVPDRFNSCNFIRAPIQCGRLSSLESNILGLSKLMRFPIELGRDFTSLHDRSRTFKCVNSSMLSGRVEIFVPDRFNSCNFIRAPIQCERLSSLESNILGLSKLTRFPIELGRDFTLLRDRSRTFKCVNSWMLSGRVEIFVRERFNFCNFIRSPIESGRLSS